MNKLIAAFVIAIGISACFGQQPDAREMKDKIAAKIWKNECGGTVKGLVSWNAGEEFPSLGIGHFIWYPAGVRGNFQESFPEFVRFAESKGIDVPSFAKGKAPWPNRKSFQASDTPNGTAARLRTWLANTTSVQADFIITRSVAALKRLEKGSRNPALVRKRYGAVASTPQGMYALIDYVNFKGEGTDPRERYNGQGWGLLQVLETMNDVESGPEAASGFSQAAKQVLRRRVDNSPASRGERRWLEGWMNRCNTYARSL